MIDKGSVLELLTILEKLGYRKMKLNYEYSKLVFNKDAFLNKISELENLNNNIFQNLTDNSLLEAYSKEKMGAFGKYKYEYYTFYGLYIFSYIVNKGNERYKMERIEGSKKSCYFTELSSEEILKLTSENINIKKIELWGKIYKLKDQIKLLESSYILLNEERKKSFVFNFRKKRELSKKIDSIKSKIEELKNESNLYSAAVRKIDSKNSKIILEEATMIKEIMTSLFNNIKEIKKYVILNRGINEKIKTIKNEEEKIAYQELQIKDVLMYNQPESMKILEDISKDSSINMDIRNVANKIIKVMTIKR